MGWRIAESLKKLREQINAAYPNRDKASDGGIGDAAHASRSSDHNPWVKDSKGQGVVTAIDIDEDLSPSNTVMPMIQSIIASRDPRVKYIIYEGKICSSYPAQGFKAWTWRPYSGKNPHRHHAHISVNPSPYHYDNRAEWNIGASSQQSAVISQPKEPAAELILEVPAAVSPIGDSAHSPTEAVTATTSPGDLASTEQPPASVAPTVSTEYLRKEKPSIFTKIIAGVTAVTTFFSGLGVGLDAVFNRIAAEITLKQVAIMAGFFGLGALALWWYDRSAQRQTKLNEQKMEIAANSDLNTVELT